MKTSCEDDSDENMLTEGEREELEATREALRDVYGTAVDVASFEQGETVLATARQRLEEAISMISPNKRTHYDQAMKQCSHLVQQESNPERFLRACRYDPWASAQRLCIYWEKRHEIFGERAFLPMDLTGNGALPKDTVEAMKCGGTTILPADSNNRPVHYSDRSRFSSRCGDENVRLQVMFYTLQTLLESDLALDNGYVIVTSMASESKKNSTNGSSISSSGGGGGGGGVKHKNTPRSKVLRLIESGAIPSKLRGVHLIVSKKRSLMESAMPIWLKLLERSKLVSLRTVAHFAESKESAFSDLKRYGFTEENTPQELGGTLDFDRYFEQWHSERLKFDRQRQALTRDRLPSSQLKTCAGDDARQQKQSQRGGRRPREDDDTDSDNDMNSSNSTASEGARALENLAVVADQVRLEEAKARKRRLDAIYQKKKRHQRKEDFSKISCELNILKKGNAALKKEQEFLESLLERAVQVVGAYENSSLTAAAVAAPASDTSDVSQPIISRASSSALQPPPPGPGLPNNQAYAFNILNQLLQNSNSSNSNNTRREAPVSATNRGGRMDSHIGASGLPHSNLDFLASSLQSGPRAPSQVELLQQLQPSLLLQQLREQHGLLQRQQQLRQIDHQQLQTSDSQTEAIRRAMEETIVQAVLLRRQQQQGLQQPPSPNEPSDVAMFLQRARSSNVPPAASGAPAAMAPAQSLAANANVFAAHQQQPNFSSVLPSLPISSMAGGADATMNIASNLLVPVPAAASAAKQATNELVGGTPAAAQISGVLQHQGSQLLPGAEAKMVQQLLGSSSNSSSNNNSRPSSMTLFPGGTRGGQGSVFFG